MGGQIRPGTHGLRIDSQFAAVAPTLPGRVDQCTDPFGQRSGA